MVLCRLPRAACTTASGQFVPEHILQLNHIHVGDFIFAYETDPMGHINQVLNLPPYHFLIQCIQGTCQAPTEPHVCVLCHPLVVLGIISSMISAVRCACLINTRLPFNTTHIRRKQNMLQISVRYAQ